MVKKPTGNPIPLSKNNFILNLKVKRQKVNGGFIFWKTMEKEKIRRKNLKPF